MANRLFSETPSFSKPRRNAFDLSFLNLISSNFGDLKVCLLKETVPGDLWQCESTALVRVAPMLAPVMANMDVYIHYFYVPNRIIWDHWNEFITGGIKGDKDPSTDPEVIPPYFSLDSNLADTIDNYASSINPFGNRTLWDSLNLPSIDYNDLVDFDEKPLDKISSLPFRAYQLIYQEYYEDELLKRPFLDPQSGKDTPLDFSVSGDELQNGGVAQVLRLLCQQKRAWGKDYFTTARPNVALTGDTLIPISGSGSISELGISGTGVVDWRNAYPSMPILRNTNGEVIQDDFTVLYGDMGHPGDHRYQLAVGYMDDITLPHYEFAAGASYDPNGSLKVDGSDFEVTGGGEFEIEGGTIRDLKLAIQTYEYDAKGQYGNRPTEWHYNHFGVIVPDKTIQRPIYLGGGKTPIMVSEVLQTAGSDYSAASGKTATPQGNMSGHGIAVAKSNRFRHYCEEYGFIIGIMSIIPKTAYYQGVPKMYSRFDKFDYYTPEFAHIGEVPVLNKELYFNIASTHNDNEETFGYQSPYADFKFSNNEIHGDFRGSLEFWHTGRKFSQLPSLNWEFIHCDHQDQLSRIFAVESENYDHFLTQIWHNLKATRLMPKFGTFKL